MSVSFSQLDGTPLLSRSLSLVPISTARSSFLLSVFLFFYFLLSVLLSLVFLIRFLIIFFGC